MYNFGAGQENCGCKCTHCTNKFGALARMLIIDLANWWILTWKLRMSLIFNILGPLVLFRFLCGYWHSSGLFFYLFYLFTFNVEVSFFGCQKVYYSLAQPLLIYIFSPIAFPIYSYVWKKKKNECFRTVTLYFYRHSTCNHVWYTKNRKNHYRK